MIGVNTTYVVELYDDVELVVELYRHLRVNRCFTTDDVDEAKYYVQTKRDNGKRYQNCQAHNGGFMKGECNLFDVEILVDLTVEFTNEDGLIVLDSVKWYGS